MAARPPLHNFCASYMPTLPPQHTSNYVGRFAPSPSGPLHFGSLVTALGSYLQAKQSQGKWLVRIEDIDPPREVAGASEQILNTLAQHGLNWDDEPVFQSQRSALYRQKIAWLLEHNYTYFCDCTRAELAALAPKTLCCCATQSNYKKHAAIRFKNSKHIKTYFDEIQQEVSHRDSEVQFAIKRKDGLFAYQLAVVADDIAQGITQVVRGADLLHATFYQLALYQAFGHKPPSFAHLPLVLSPNGSKLSKQNHAPAIDNQQVELNLFHAMCFLGLSPPKSLQTTTVKEILNWGINAWQLSAVPPEVACNDNRIKALYSI